MKTAIQELLEELKEANSRNNFIQTTINLIIDMVEEKLEKEKEQINIAYLEGFKSSNEGHNAEYPFEGCTDESIALSINSESYYENKYNYLH